MVVEERGPVIDESDCKEFRGLTGTVNDEEWCCWVAVAGEHPTRLRIAPFAVENYFCRGTSVSFYFSFSSFYFLGSIVAAYRCLKIILLSCIRHVVCCQ